MADFVQIKGMASLKNKINIRIDKARTTYRQKLNVGFAAEYCIFVHERTDLKHAPPTQAKFLEQPARQFRRQIGGVIRFALQRGKPFAEALHDAGWFLLKKAYPLVPVDTGHLKSSGFVEVK